MTIENGSKVRIIGSEFAGREGVVLEKVYGYGVLLYKVRVPLLGMYAGRSKVKLFHEKSVAPLETNNDDAND